MYAPSREYFSIRDEVRENPSANQNRTQIVRHHPRIQNSHNAFSEREKTFFVLIQAAHDFAAIFNSFTPQLEIRGARRAGQTGPF